jgi:hypothetical protein
MGHRRPAGGAGGLLGLPLFRRLAAAIITTAVEIEQGSGDSDEH